MQIEQNIMICQWQAEKLFAKAKANKWSARHWQITIFCNNQVQEYYCFYFNHQVCFRILITSWQLREAICHFSLKNVVPITYEQNIICSKMFKRYYAWEDHYLLAFICRSCGGLSANVKGKNTLNDNLCYLLFVPCPAVEKFPWKPYNKSVNDRACSVKMARYWPHSFCASLSTVTESRSIRTQKNLANIQPSWPHTWSITHICFMLQKLEWHSGLWTRWTSEASLVFFLNEWTKEQMTVYWFP